MCQLCAVDLVRLDVCDRASDGCGTEDSKLVRGLIRGVHLLLALPQSHSEHLALLWVGEEQAATEPDCILSAGRRCSSTSACSCWRRSESTEYWLTLANITLPPFLLEAWTLPLCITLWTYVGLFRGVSPGCGRRALGRRSFPNVGEKKSSRNPVFTTNKNPDWRSRARAYLQESIHESRGWVAEMTIPTLFANQG